MWLIYICFCIAGRLEIEDSVMAFAITQICTHLSNISIQSFQFVVILVVAKAFNVSDDRTLVDIQRNISRSLSPLVSIFILVSVLANTSVSAAELANYWLNFEHRLGQHRSIPTMIRFDKRPVEGSYSDEKGGFGNSMFRIVWLRRKWRTTRRYQSLSLRIGNRNGWYAAVA